MEISESLLALVRSEARRVQRRLPPHAITLDDLTGQGHLGLVEARDRFDPRLGVPFELFARRRIRGAILDSLRSQGLLRRRGWEDLRRQALAHDILEAEPGAASGPEDDAAALGETVQRLAAAFLTDAALHLQGAPEDPEASLAESQLGARLRTAIEALPTKIGRSSTRSTTSAKPATAAPIWRAGDRSAAPTSPAATSASWSPCAAR